MTETIRCFWVDKNEAGEVQAAVTDKPVEILDAQPHESPGIRIRVELSSLNYKDALAATGHPGIVRTFPHIPGIDAVGTVIESPDSRYQPGERVIVTGNEFGVSHFGGWAEQIQVPPQWVVRLPESLTPLAAMSLGTAGFTAAQCVQALIAHEVTPEKGPVVVTGATGGVASIAIELLNKLGYRIIAVTGKEQQHAALRQRGVDEIIPRTEFIDESERPMLSGKYAGAVDTVGGSMLATLLKAAAYRSCVATCGMTGGTDLNTTVYPFILRGVTLAGIDAAACPMPNRIEIWDKLSGDWKLDGIESLVTRVPLSEIPQWVDTILAGQVSGRVVVDVG